MLTLLTQIGQVHKVTDSSVLWGVVYSQRSVAKQNAQGLYLWQKQVVDVFNFLPDTVG